MKLSIHSVIRGKPIKVIDGNGRPWLEQDGVRVNLGYGWTNIDCDWDTAFELITVDGVATSAELLSNNRKDVTFVSRELVMVDIDNGMTIAELLADSFYLDNAAGYYTTPSHTEEAPRFRIMFRCATPITDADVMRKVYRALLEVYSSADVSCKDPTRLFYGAINSQHKEKRDVLLSDEMVQMLVSLTEARDAELPVQEVVEHKPLNDAAKQRILDLLKITPVYNYTVWSRVGWGLKDAGFSLNDFLYVTAGMMKQKGATEAKKVWDCGNRADGQKATLGTVIHLLKQHHGQDCLKYGRGALSVKNLANDNQI